MQFSYVSLTMHGTKFIYYKTFVTNSVSFSKTISVKSSIPICSRMPYSNLAQPVRGDSLTTPHQLLHAFSALIARIYAFKFRHMRNAAHPNRSRSDLITSSTSAKLLRRCVSRWMYVCVRFFLYFTPLFLCLINNTPAALTMTDVAVLRLL